MHLYGTVVTAVNFLYIGLEIFMFQMCMVHKGKPLGGRSPFCLRCPVLQATWCHGVAEQAAKVAGVRWGQPQVNLKSTSSQPLVNVQVLYGCCSSPVCWVAWRPAQVRTQVTWTQDTWARRFHVQSWHLSCCKCDHKVRTEAIWPEDTMAIIEVVMSEVRELRLHDQRGHRGNPRYL